MALELDHLQDIISVNWTGGLAVEFAERPSYLVLNQSLSWNRVTISFWFRIPREAVQAVQTRDADAANWDFAMLPNCVPLLMFGEQRRGEVYDWEGGVIGTLPFRDAVYDPSPVPIYGNYIVGSHMAPMLPSCIAVQFNPDDPTGQGLLLVHIQTDDMATGANLAQEDTGIEIIDTSGQRVVWEKLTRDVTYSALSSPEYLGNNDFHLDTAPPVSIDEWHHLLISWDLMGGNSSHGSDEPTTIAAGTGAYSLMWCALDDVNYDRENLPALWIEDGNPNGHLSITPWIYADWNNRYGPATVDVSFSDLVGTPLVIPAPAALDRATDPFGLTQSINVNQKVEMAELQIFTGVTLDTSSVLNRRAFVDFESGTKKPADPSKAETLLGQKPDVLLHGTTKWQKGKNTGSLGIDGEGNELPPGQFNPTGEINRYKPDPSL